MVEPIRKLSQSYLKLKNSPYRRYFIETRPFEDRLSILLGQRGIGKTTTLVQHLLDQVDQDIHDPRILYVPADHCSITGTTLYDIAAEFNSVDGKYLALDDIHTYPNWSQELKSIYDTFPRLNVVAAASSALNVYSGSHDLSRCAIRYTMVGLSFREFLELHLNMKFSHYSLDEIISSPETISAEIIERIEAQDLKILSLFQKYLYHGYYPCFFELASEELYFAMLEQNMDKTIESDLAAIYPNLNDSCISTLKKLLVYIGGSVPFTPGWNTIKDFLEIEDKRTLKTYFKYLEDASLIRSIEKPVLRLDRVRLEERIYLDNPNQMQVLSFENRNVATMLETFFLDMVSLRHEVALTQEDYFCIDKMYCFELEFRKKLFQYNALDPDPLLIVNALETGIGAKIPLWLFGFLY